jgi:hypothetical protein
VQSVGSEAGFSCLEAVGKEIAKPLPEAEKLAEAILEDGKGDGEE